jgi:uncharacterized protein (TIGR02145 family)
MKTKEIFRIIITISCLVPVLPFPGCRKDDLIIKDKVTGLVQKGPFINGTTISMYELNSSMAQTGNSFTTQISNNLGSFEIDNVSLSSGYVLLMANGYYYDEVRGFKSTSPLTLYALTDITGGSTVNINILTHLEKSRIEYLAKSMPFNEAKQKAQSDVLSVFGFSEDIGPSELLDISAVNDANAILLAVTVIIQGIRNTAQLTEFLANIATDIRDDGQLDEDNVSELRNTILTVNIPAIRSRLYSRYRELGIEADIPPFEEYIGRFLAFTGSRPYVIAKPAADVSTTAATLQGLVNANDLQSSVSFEYGTSINYGSTVPAVPSVVNGHSLTSVSAAISNLDPEAVYHYRVKAENEKGTSYSPDMIMARSGLLTDIDGNTYQTVVIGNQVWMAENLKVTKYQDGNVIPYVSDKDTWNLLTSGAQCCFNNDTSKINVYGRLYNFNAVIDSRKLCPAGWHVPSDEEWTILSDYLVSSGYGYQGSGTDIAKSLASENGWITYGTAGCIGNDMTSNNATGFSALPGGLRNLQGMFVSIDFVGVWGSRTPVNETDAWFRILNFNYTEFGRSQNKKSCGVAIRCLKD